MLTSARGIAQVQHATFLKDFVHNRASELFVALPAGDPTTAQQISEQLTTEAIDGDYRNLGVNFKSEWWTKVTGLAPARHHDILAEQLAYLKIAVRSFSRVARIHAPHSLPVCLLTCTTLKMTARLGTVLRTKRRQAFSCLFV